MQNEFLVYALLKSNEDKEFKRGNNSRESVHLNLKVIQFKVHALYKQDRIILIQWPGELLIVHRSHSLFASPGTLNITTFIIT